MRILKSRLSVLSVAVWIATLVAAAAQQPTFKRTELQRGDLAIAGREAVQALAEFPAGVQSGRHSHPGEELAYVLEGTVPARAPQPLLFQQSMQFIDRDGRTIRYETVYSHGYPTPRRAR